MINKELADGPAQRMKVNEDLSAHVGAVLRELSTVKVETGRLLEQRRQLEVYLSALKTELETLRAEKVELMAERIQMAPEAVEEANDLDLVGTPLPTPVTAPGARPTPAPQLPRPSKSTPSHASPDHEDAFAAFLGADEDHDKSREWFLSKSS
ncbi:MAG: hypothetical protein HKN03_07730 [Acidimicrobiales bacterium]|nr:hypothetical protein [Acidimicrobiales bacterium]